MEVNDRDRREIERYARRYGREKVAEIARNAPFRTGRGREPMWETEQMAMVISLTEAKLPEGEGVEDAVVSFAKRFLDPTGLAALAANQHPQLREIAEFLGGQSSETRRRRIRGHKARA